MSYGSFSSNYNNPLANFGSALGGASNQASGLRSKFSNNKVVSGTTDFLYSNSLVWHTYVRFYGYKYTKLFNSLGLHVIPSFPEIMALLYHSV